jgi:transcriptional regulator with XRE-family HTH domain
MVPRPDKRGGSDLVHRALMDAVRFGRQLRALRRRRGWRQQDLGAASGVSRATIARIELGGAGRQQVQTLETIATALSAHLDARLLWNGESLDRLLDQAHASIVNELTRRLVAAAWDVAPEVSFSIFGERGSIDILAFHPAEALLLVVEVKSVLPDLQAMLVTLDRKARLAPRIARDRGWRAASVGRILVLAGDRTARRRVEAHESVLRAAFPTRGIAVKRWLRQPDQPISGLLFVSDVRGVNARHRIPSRMTATLADSVTRASHRGRLSHSR